MEGGNYKMKVEEYILSELQKKYTFGDDINIENLNYVESGYVDSLGMIQFVVGLEDEFDIEFAEEELTDPSFRIVGELIKLIERKVKDNE